MQGRFRWHKNKRACIWIPCSSWLRCYCQSLFYWSNLAASVHNSDVQVVQTPVSEETSNRSSLVSSSSETNVDMHQDVANKESNLPALQRRHSDSSCLAPANISCQLGNQLPGIASMLHRRRLRALCRRCQYGKAAATLNRLYPQVLERCPELLVQLRCRQLIEMMHRHAVRRVVVMHQIQEVNIMMPIQPQPLQKFKEQDKSPQDTSDSIQKVIENGTPLLSMDVDSEDLPKPSHTEDAQNVEQKGEADLKSNLLTDLDDDLEAGDLEDDEDDDGFGVDDDTGVCINTLLPPQNVKACQSNSLSCTPSGMDVDSEVLSAESKSKSTKDGFGAVSSNSEMNSDDEMRCLLRHVQFGRSLVNLVRQVRAKTGGLSLETERLLQQSVSLLAYPSPTSSDCPLRGLLDPVWRDTIASIINSAVLKAHDLPAQPALEHGLRALQRCFQDKNFVEAQTLGHFLLYHLTPAQIAKVDEEVAAIEASAQHQTGKRLRSSISQSNGDQTNEADGNTSSGSRNTEVNGHNTVRPRARRCRRRRQVDGTVSESQSSEHTDECNSSVEEVNKEEEEEDDDDEEEGGCDSEQDDEDFDNDDDDEDGGMAVPSRRPNTRSSAQTTSVGAQNDRDSSESRGSNGGSSGRVHSNNFSNIAILTPLGTVNTASPNVHLGRQTILTRYCPAFLLDSSRTRLGTAISTSSLPTPHRSPAFSRRLTTSTTSAQPPRSEEDCQFDSAFQGLLSVSYPQHAEFLAAMDDALKAYAGSLLTEDEQAFMPNPQNQHSREDPPSPTGGGACA
ncbi:unnamed protein product [Heterobilharzia americana]|nr:unnamed protein product [Heterobilharzia americana]